MLTLYKNIKRLRENIGMSQESLAKLTGYSDRSSIAKIEKGLVDLQQSKIELFAEALKTTSSDLMGWDDLSNESFEGLYNNISSNNLEELERYAKYLQLSQWNQIDEKTVHEYTKFVIANKIDILNHQGKKEALKRVSELTEIPRYTTEYLLNASHERTDIELPNGIDTSDDDIMDDENF